MVAFLKDLFSRGVIDAARVWSYCPTYIDAAQAEQIAGPKPASAQKG